LYRSKIFFAEQQSLPPSTLANQAVLCSQKIQNWLAKKKYFAWTHCFSPGNPQIHDQRTYMGRAL